MTSMRLQRLSEGALFALFIGQVNPDCLELVASHIKEPDVVQD